MATIPARMRFFAIGGLGLMIAGCSHTALPPGGLIAQATSDGSPAVSVSVDGSQIAPERQKVFEERGGAEALANGVLARLAETGKQVAPGPSQLRIVVTNFRLRSTGSGFWLGAMAGADKLDVSVTVVHDGEVLRTYTTGVAGVMAGVIKPSATGRFNGLIAVASERIVQEL